ncbi:MAG TPA: hypothetical protein VFO46_02355 [Candidatus Sulfotelmatobacter sp.]|nr:hypothetical protein [Candidatus Sulfotelmatobacter sp.]
MKSCLQSVSLNAMWRRIRNLFHKLQSQSVKSSTHTPPPDPRAENRYLRERLNEEHALRSALERNIESEAAERFSELIEARQMAGAGPWRISPDALKQTDALIQATAESLRGGKLSLRETPLLAQGAYGDIELALQNVEWRRQINLSWLEFSRWGIQQIILISRLYYIKNPLIQRGINVAAHYVFGRGCEVSSPDEDANTVLKEFFERNRSTLGQNALTELERRKYYDGNIFFALFTDRLKSGQTSVRTIDATEIQDIVTDPEDADTPWFYRRQWTERLFNPQSGQTGSASREAWYPALGYDPDDKPDMIGGKPVMWGVPILHRKSGAVSKWHFGCPIVYAALDWAKASRRFLEACATVKQALSQIAMTITSKGGQAALEGMKQQLSTTVGPSSSLWDENPPPVNASIFAAGPGTTIQPFRMSRMGGDPEEVRRFELMVWRVFGLPETFGGDVKTGNLATATSLDRPTELNFLEKQEAWREDLLTISRYVLSVSAGAAGGMLRESLEKRKVQSIGKISIREAKRSSQPGRTVRYEAAKPSDDTIEIMVTFPNIVEGDVPQLVAAVVDAMTLGNKGGQIVGVDEKAGIRKLYEIAGIENGDEIIEEQYPSTGADKYDPNRTKEDAAALKAPISSRPPYSPPGPELPGGEQRPAPVVPAPKEALARLMEAARKLRRKDAA